MPCKQKLPGACTLEIVVVEVAFGRNEELDARIGPCTSLVLSNRCFYVVLGDSEFNVQLVAIMEYPECCFWGIWELFGPVTAINGVLGQPVENLL